MHRKSGVQTATSPVKSHMTKATVTQRSGKSRLRSRHRGTKGALTQVLSVVCAGELEEEFPA